MHEHKPAITKFYWYYGASAHYYPDLLGDDGVATIVKCMCARSAVCLCSFGEHFCME